MGGIKGLRYCSITFPFIHFCFECQLFSQIFCLPHHCGLTLIAVYDSAIIKEMQRLVSKCNCLFHK